VTMISRSVAISIAGGGGAMVHDYLSGPKACLIWASSYP